MGMCITFILALATTTYAESEAKAPCEGALKNTCDGFGTTMEAAYKVCEAAEKIVPECKKLAYNTCTTSVNGASFGCKCDICGDEPSASNTLTYRIVIALVGLV